ncbi:peptidyl-prolyl cis-trans isomerase [Pycnococcus provasolii]
MASEPCRCRLLVWAAIALWQAWGSHASHDTLADRRDALPGYRETVLPIQGGKWRLPGELPVDEGDEDKDSGASGVPAEDAMFAPACIDLQGDRCATWAASGECENNRQFMEVKCVRSCGMCKPVASTHVARACGVLPGDISSRVADPARAKLCARLRLTIREKHDGGEGSAVEVALFSRHVPRTAANFERLCIRTDGNGFVGTTFHRVIPEFMMQGGSTRTHTSIYGERFEDESFAFRYDEPFLLGMANGGANTNNDQFFVTVAKCPHLDDKHVVFGAVTAGFDVVKRVVGDGSASGAPTKIYEIAGCEYVL